MIGAVCKRVGALVETGHDVVFLTADIGGDGIDSLAARIGDRFIDMGIAEATMIGAAAGFGLSGTTPVIYGLATFLSRRALEQIKIDLLANDLGGIVLGGASGTTLSALGPTHSAHDDIALMRSLGDVSIFSPRNGAQAADALSMAVAARRLCYVRLAPEPDQAGAAAAFGDGVFDLVTAGDNVALLTTGPCLPATRAAREQLAALAAIRPAVIHLKAIYPLDRENIISLLLGYELIVTVEDHLRSGGLGSVIGEMIAESPGRMKLIRIGAVVRGHDLFWSDGKFSNISLEQTIIYSIRTEMERIR